MSALAAVVVFVTLLAPFGKLIGTLYVLLRLHEASPPRHLRRVFVLAERLRPWSMIEVFVFGVFVAYVKLGDLVQIGLDTGVYALLALTVRYDLGRQRARPRGGLATARLAEPGADRSAPQPSRRHSPHAVGCEICGLVSVPRPDDPRCPRCGTRLHARKPDSVGADLGAGDRRRDALRAGELLPGADGHAARRWVAQDDHRRRARSCWRPACIRSRRWCSSPASRCRC